MKKVILSIMIILMPASLSYAAEGIVIKCDTCDLRSEVIEGPTMLGSALCLTDTVMYCTECKNFFSVETGFCEHNSLREKLIVDFETLKLIEDGKYIAPNVFEGQSFVHDKCGRRACIYNYRGSKCPKCSKGTIDVLPDNHIMID